MRFLFIPLAMLLASAVNAADVHRIVLHLDEADPERQNLVLNNASNINNYYLDKGEEAEIEIVAYGPGLTLLVPGKSPAGDRVKSISQSYNNVKFKACGNTLTKMSKKAGKEIKLMPEAEIVPAGVIHLVQRQEEGWSYIRP
ncbi:MAG: DsrE family protein [Chromatiaceae bacterium]|nr:DsrE family protein [Gammaproteobacteria bacterium]MCP5304127.1 DsrE family protein [Chromatiaceae bacterium]MCP5313853.1 DsrE family protein [Chromatiaceae bacterium]